SGSTKVMSTPGQPTANSFAESFAEDALYARRCISTSIKPVRRRQPRLRTFLEEIYNAKRLHSSFDDVYPDELKYAMCSRLCGLDFLGALQIINCQTNCQSSYFVDLDSRLSKARN